VVRIPAVVIGAFLVLASSMLLAGCGGKKAAAITTTIVRHHGRPLPKNAIRVHWKPAALVPAARPGRVCIVTYKTGHFCASYALGEIPSVNLRRKLRTKGWVVVTTP
jgi:hypothetical protein